MGKQNSGFELAVQTAITIVMKLDDVAAKADDLITKGTQKITSQSDEFVNTYQQRWSHLNGPGERAAYEEAIKQYDEILQIAENTSAIANRYQVSIEDILRAKDHAFGSGVSKYGFVPDAEMAAAWKRIIAGNATDVDEILLRHEILESSLVSQGIAQVDAHKIANETYNWAKALLGGGK